eukprot:scaffold1136_cov260-Pinguiococcus_pyrenoidosus.AAC.2
MAAGGTIRGRPSCGSELCASGLLCRAAEVVGQRMRPLRVDFSASEARPTPRRQARGTKPLTTFTPMIAPALTALWASCRHLQAPNEDFEAEALPLWLSQLGELLSSAILNDEPSIPPDHVLVNEYQSDEGILAHTDGPFYHPCTMTISLLMPAVVRFRPRLRPEEIGKVPNAAVDMVLEPGSVLLFTGEAYSDWTHEVWGPDSAMLEDVSASMKALLEEGSVDGSRRRVSLTLRRVKKQPSAD